MVSVAFELPCFTEVGEILWMAGGFTRTGPPGGAVGRGFPSKKVPGACFMAVTQD